MAETVRLVRGIGAALAYVHRQGLIHCDNVPRYVKERLKQ